MLKSWRYGYQTSLIQRDPRRKDDTSQVLKIHEIKLFDTFFRISSAGTHFTLRWLFSYYECLTNHPET